MTAATHKYGACLLALLLMASSARAVESPATQDQAAAVVVEGAWIRLLPPPLPNGGYAVLRNTGDVPVVLTGVSGDSYAHVMLHQSNASSGVSSMQHVERLRIPAHGKVLLEPGGYHLMLMHPTHEIHIGQQVTLQFRFEDGSTQATEFAVRDATGAPTHDPTTPRSP